MSYTLEELHEAQWKDMNNKIEAARKELIKALWPQAADRPEYAEYMTLDELISAVCARLEANRYYLERKTNA